jgi:hypothetical protein
VKIYQNKEKARKEKIYLLDLWMIKMMRSKKNKRRIRNKKIKLKLQ